jgi:uncharacterized protein (DUF1330 family)
MEAQILEVQELGLRTAIFFSDRMQAPIGRLIHFGNLQKMEGEARHATAELESAMTVYVIAQLKMTDRAAYDRYQARFFEVFRKFSGRLLSADESPSVVEGDWNRDKLVLMSFPDETAYHAWADSPEYLEISKDREAGAQAIVLLAKGFPPQA